MSISVGNNVPCNALALLADTRESQDYAMQAIPTSSIIMNHDGEALEQAVMDWAHGKHMKLSH